MNYTICVELPGCFGRVKFALLCKENRIFPSDQRPGLLNNVDIGAGIASTGISPPLSSYIVERTYLLKSLYFFWFRQFLWSSLSWRSKKSIGVLWCCMALGAGQSLSPNSEIQHSVRQESVGSLAIPMSWKKYNFLKKNLKKIWWLWVISINRILLKCPPIFHTCFREFRNPITSQFFFCNSHSKI